MRRSATLTLLVSIAVVTAGCTGFGPFSIPQDGGVREQRPDSMNVTVAWVEDGDTLWFYNDSGTPTGIRLIGLDTPEKRGQNYPEEYPGIPDTESGTRWLDAWANRSTEAMRERVDGKTVRLVFDPGLPKRDLYGRLLAYVYLNGTLLNRAFVEEGYGRVYPVEFERRDSFEDAQAAARDADRGLWNYSENRDGRLANRRPSADAPRRWRNVHELMGSRPRVADDASKPRPRPVR